jgi:hypothetical protein
MNKQLTFGDLNVGDFFHLQVSSGLLVDVDHPRPELSRALVKLSARRYRDDGTGDIYRIGSVKARVWREAPAPARSADIFTPTAEQASNSAHFGWLLANNPAASTVMVGAVVRHRNA